MAGTYLVFGIGRAECLIAMFWLGERSVYYSLIDSVCNLPKLRAKSISLWSSEWAKCRHFRRPHRPLARALVHTFELSFINKCVPKWVSISLTLFVLQMTYELTFHICDLWQRVNLTFNPYGIYFQTTCKKISYFVN